jgi:hypothetical protein
VHTTKKLKGVRDPDLLEGVFEKMCGKIYNEKDRMMELPIAHATMAKWDRNGTGVTIYN